jgi:hypothetical protein
MNFCMSLDPGPDPAPEVAKNKKTSVPEIIDRVFTKTSPKRSFCMTENEHFGLVFTKTGSINFQKPVIK